MLSFTLQLISKKFDWSSEQQGWILSSFYIGYIISHVPGGLIAERYGGKWTLALSVLSIIICTVVTPIAVELGGYFTLIVLRILMGISAGTNFPALTVLVAAFVPKKERSTLGTIALGGSQVRITFIDLIESSTPNSNHHFSIFR